MAFVVCNVCAKLVEDFTTSSYRLPGGKAMGRVCADCGQKPTAKEQAKLEEYMLKQAELAEFANDQQEYELAMDSYTEPTVNAHPVFRVAETRVCVCPKPLKDVVYIDSVDGGGDEHDRLDGYYCVSCNSFWREL